LTAARTAKDNGLGLELLVQIMNRPLPWLAPTLLLLSGPVLAAEKRPLRVDDLFAIKDVGDPRLSPDGAFVAYTLTTIDAKKDKADTDLYLSPVDGGEALRLTASPKGETKPRFSPDGKHLAFLSKREGKKTQVYLLPRRGGEAVKLTDYPGDVSDLAWSPDSRKLALVVSDRDPDEVEEGKDDEEDASRTPKPIVVRRLQFKTDGTGFLREVREHLHVFDLESKTSVQVTDGPYDDSKPVWTPDGATLVFVSNRTPDPDANRNTDLFAIAPRQGAVPRALTTAPTSAHSPAMSPDGTLVAYVEGGDPADLYYAVEHLSVVPVAGGASRPLTKALDRNPQAPSFSPDGKSVLFLLEDRGDVHLARVPAAGGAVARVVSGPRVLSAFDVARDGRIVVVESQPDRPEEISAVQKDGSLKRVTRLNDELMASLRLGATTKHEAKSGDGTVVDYFVVRPPGAPAMGALPAVLRIHGGPVSQYQNEFTFEFQLLAAHGYAVVAANPRGSSGRGRDFSRAIWADWGGKDHDDVMAAVDDAIARGIADPERLGVGGWSYGGILTDWTIYRTTRFKAAIAGAGIANALAGYGTDQYQWEYETELGLPWKNRETWLHLSRPFLEADKIKTPTLFVCGEVDWNVPLINSEQMYQALRRTGVPTELVVYPGEDHSIGKPSYRKDRYERYLAWYDRYLKPAAAETAAAEATSLLGRPLAPPALTDEQKKAYEEALARATADFVKDPDSAEAIVWLGRRTAYLGRYRDAIAIFTRGADKFPDDVRFLRHRGHRYLTVRELDKAAADLQKAADLIASRKIPDAVEPDGIPGPPGSTPSTNHFNVYYHLGLAYFLKADYGRAEAAYRECLKYSESSPDSLAATRRWLWASLRHQGRNDEAERLLAGIARDPKVAESASYQELLLLYKKEKTPRDVLARAAAGLDHPTLVFGVGDFHLVNGNRAEAMALFREAVRGPQWAAFGYLAAEAALARKE
jgi:dipeptidyl aminopeptidase/acylaminoacyl peptidase/TolA-binding protein